MLIVRIEHSVPDYERWKRVFDSDPADRKGSGVRRYEVLRDHDDRNFVMIDLEFDTIDQAQAFVRKMEGIWNGPGRAVMQGPRSRIVERAAREEL